MSVGKHLITAVVKDKRGRVLSMGQNSYVKTHPMQAFHANKVGLPQKVFLHAEMVAIIKCKDLTKAHSISIFRYGRLGTPLNAKPCPICMSAIESSGIKVIEHT